MLQLTIFTEPIYKHTTFEQDGVAFKESTGVKLYCDGFMSAFCGRKQLDLPKISKSLEIPNGVSLREYLYNNCGSDIEYLIDKWTFVPNEIE